MRYNWTLALLLFIFSASANAQRHDSLTILEPEKITRIVDTSLRITNLNPFFSLHVDSSLNYKLQINRKAKPDQYFWYLKNPPAGLRIDKDSGIVSFKANKSLFLSGRLKYDTDYPVTVGVQNLNDPKEKVDTTFTITWYNTDVILPKIKASVVGDIVVTEGEKVNFNVMCENGNFPIDQVLFSSNVTISNFKAPSKCNEPFQWTPSYDFVNEKDSARTRIVTLYFIGTTKFNYSDTARVRVVVKDGLDFDASNLEYYKQDSALSKWIKDLKITFFMLDQKIRKTRGTRSTFEISAAASTLAGTALSTLSDSKSTQNVGKALPGISVAAVPIKEVAAPSKNTEQNQATLIRSTIKRLEYIQFDNRLSGDRDPLVTSKTETLRKERSQSQIQLAEVPMEDSSQIPERVINEYFNSQKVQRKYRMK
ncbi:MAG: hypothetical protein QM727_01755 [Niabella sp.]